jgi:hypothetical protein
MALCEGARVGAAIAILARTLANACAAREGDEHGTFRGGSSPTRAAVASTASTRSTRKGPRRRATDHRRHHREEGCACLPYRGDMACNGDENSFDCMTDCGPCEGVCGDATGAERALHDLRERLPLVAVHRQLPADGQDPPFRPQRRRQLRRLARGHSEYTARCL